MRRPLPKRVEEDEEDFDDTIKLEDTLTLATRIKDSSTSREDAKFHEMSK